jgi:hypothetical protein
LATKQWGSEAYFICDREGRRIGANNYNHETEKNEEEIYHFSPTTQ